MWEWEERLARSEGYSVSGSGISREALVDATIWAAETKKQRVHRYEYFTADVPHVRVSLKEEDLEGLSPEVIMQLARQGQWELEAWGVEIFGKTRDNGYGGIETVSTKIDKTPAVSFEQQHQQLWRDNGFIDPPTIRSLAEIKAQIVGAVVGAVATVYLGPLGAVIGGAATWTTSITDSLLFATLDHTTTNKDNKDVWAEFGKQASITTAMSAMSFGTGAAGYAASAAGTFAQAAIAAGTSYANSVSMGYLNAIDFRTGKMDWDTANAGWYSANTIAGALGAGVNGGLNGLNMGKNGEKLFGFSVLNQKNVGKLNGLVGALAGEGLQYAMGGDFTLNILNTGLFSNSSVNVGLLELHLGSEGARMNVGTGGANVSIENIYGAMQGAMVWNVNNRISRYTETNEFKSEVALRAQYGFGDDVQMAQLWDILNGVVGIRVGAQNDYDIDTTLEPKITLEAETTLEDGKRVINIMNYQEGMSPQDEMRLAVILGHEAYRDGYGLGEINGSGYYVTSDDLYKDLKDASIAKILMGDRINQDYNWFYDRNQDLRVASYLYAASVITGNATLFDDYLRFPYNDEDKSQYTWQFSREGTFYTEQIINQYEQTMHGLLPQDYLKDIVDTAELAKIMLADKTGALDEFTAKYISGLGDTIEQQQTALEKILNNITIYSDFGASSKAMAIINNLFKSNIFYGVSSGNNIYLREAITRDPNGNVSIDPYFAALIGHEAIHSIQAAAVGKLVFVNYSLNMPYSDKNSYELSAYKFGAGFNASAFKKAVDYKKTSGQIFMNIFINNGRWW